MVHQLVRAHTLGHGHVHACAASMIGGTVAHEAVKLVTQQYLPLDNLLVLDHRTGKSFVTEL